MILWFILRLIHSFLPVEERYEFLRPSSFKSTKHLGDGFRIKTIKLKNKLSQGLILPLDEVAKSLTTSTQLPNFKEGTDLTSFLGIKKYEKPLSPQLGGVAKGNFPSFLRKTDQERVQNLFDELKQLDQDDEWEATLKLDGSSMTVYLNNGEFGVCSRNLDLKETAENTFWQVARKLELEDAMRAVGKNFALQGELMGPGVQGNRENLPEHNFYLFDVWDIDEQRYLGSEEKIKFILFGGLGSIKPVPIIDYVKLNEFDSVDAFLKYADISSLNHPVAEGVVFKHQSGEHSFKVINNRFLLNEKD